MLTRRAVSRFQVLLKGCIIWCTQLRGCVRWLKLCLVPRIKSAGKLKDLWQFPGYNVEVLDDNGKQVAVDQPGNIVLTTPWPSMLRTVYNDPAKYSETYWTTFPGKYLSGDKARVDKDGYIWALGRADDVLKVAGHRISNAFRRISRTLSERPLGRSLSPRMSSSSMTFQEQGWKAGTQSDQGKGTWPAGRRYLCSIQSGSP